MFEMTPEDKRAIKLNHRRRIAAIRRNVEGIKKPRPFSSLRDVTRSSGFRDTYPGINLLEDWDNE